MSIILDALKKIEKKKQRGSVPDIMTDHLTDSKKPGRRMLWLYLLLGALVINALVLAAIFMPVEKGDDETVAESVSPPDTIAMLSERAETGPALPSPQEPVHAKEQTVMSEDAPDEKQDSRASSLPAPEHHREAAESVPAVSDEAAVPAVQTTPAADVPKPEVTDTPSEEMASASLGLTQTELNTLRDTIKKEQGSPQGAVPGPEEAADRSAEGSKNSIVEFSQLPADIKKDIPKIALSGHIYSNNPGSRIATINGRMVREGDGVADDLVVEKITVSGVIFRYKEHRFRIRTF